MKQLRQWARRVRWGRLSLLSLLSPLLLSCGDSAAPITDPNAIQVTDNTFEPATLTVPAGTAVTWTWTGTLAHNVTSDNGAFVNSEIQAAGSHKITFSAPGTYHYHCTIHGTTTTGMRGAVVVQTDTSIVSGG